MKNRYIPLTLLSALAVTTPCLGESIRTAPRLVVSITIDQLRTDYLEAFAPLYTEGGFRRLMEGGTVYDNVSYPFSPIDRASAMASVATGTTPYYHSVVGAEWLDRETLRPVQSVDNKKFPGLGTNESSAPTALATSTIGDELKVATDGRAIVYSVGPFRDAAVLSAGHAADGALWLDDYNGCWVTSQYYYKTLPSWIGAQNNVNSPSRTIDRKEWTPAGTLSGSFSYFMGGGAQKPFSHRFTGNKRFRQYKVSGLVNEDVTDMATQCVGCTGMGLDGVTDLLNVTYYAGTFDHKSVKESQMELQDTYVRLDTEIERLINAIEKKVGADNVLFVITGTGTGDDDVADYTKYKIPSGTFHMDRTGNLLNMYLGGLYGSGHYVDACHGTQIYLDHKTFEQKHLSLTEASGKARELLSMLSGVRNIYTAQELLDGGKTATDNVRAGFNYERNGDIVIEVAPGWKILNEETQASQTARASYIQFPIIIFGAGVKAERIALPVTTDRIAPTIAKAIRIRAPNACKAQPLF